VSVRFVSSSWATAAARETVTADADSRITIAYKEKERRRHYGSRRRGITEVGSDPGLNVQSDWCRHSGDKKQGHSKLETYWWAQFRPSRPTKALYNDLIKLVATRINSPACASVSFTKCMPGMSNRNFLNGEKLSIVLPVSSIPQRMDLSPLPVSGLFFAQFPGAQRKNPRSTPMWVSLSSPILAQGLDFCERIMISKCFLVYMRRSINRQKENPPG